MTKTRNFILTLFALATASLVIASYNVPQDPDGTLRFNAASFTSLTISNAITSVQAIRQYEGVLTHAGTTTLDFDGATTCNFMSATGNVLLASANLNTNRVYVLRLLNAQATNITVNVPLNTTTNAWGIYGLAAAQTNIVISPGAETIWSLTSRSNINLGVRGVISAETQ